MKFISTVDLKGKIDRGEPLLMIDTREPEKFAECHISGAVNIPQIDLPENLHCIPREIPVIIYCLYGIKSQAPYLYLTEKAKFKNIYILDGGLFQWASDFDPSMPIV